MAVDISKFSTMKIGGSAIGFKKIRSRKDLLRAIELSKKMRVPFFVLGKGSNTIFKNKKHSIIILKMENRGMSVKNSGKRGVLIEVGAGETWDDFVAWSVKNKFSGIEALSGIPGTVGAAPIQNIGAYGSEVGEIIVFVEAYNTKTEEFIKIPKGRCGFKYRDSVFKKNPGELIVWSVCFNLRRDSNPKIPKHKDVIRHLEREGIEFPGLRDIRRIILKIRKKKIPDPKLIPNCGSFFKNPILKNTEVGKLKSRYPEIPIFPKNKNSSKLSAGWLIERAGFGGRTEGGLKVSEKNALVILNIKKGSFRDLDLLTGKIKKRVFKMFKVGLEEEVNIIG